ncbi:ATPase MORC2-like isoform X2 [Lineus longissimus]|uniref:ATPase MORC2-like isoform X2 n=1 Tax=Lineus longissimus TaxID=88925 RepID=UPI002B4CEF9D
MAYTGLSRAQLSFDYLHTNSTTHEFLFGALAELVDNARDATARKIDIFTMKDEQLRGGFVLCFLDDGEGMDPDETSDIITFGKSSKRSMDSHLIGMYGNGLKSGSMRIGNDIMLFTKKGQTMTCLFLSRTFHEEENIEEVIVPIPSFEKDTKKPIVTGVTDRERQAVEMGLILKYSPFRTESEFFDQFNKIPGKSGTLIMVYNLKLLDNGEPELDINTDREDILLSNPTIEEFDSDEGLLPERRSFRAYTSILYADPRMKIYIQGRKVRTKRLASCLYRPKMYKYSSNRFRARSELEVKKSIDDAKIAEMRAKEADSKAKGYQNKHANLTKDQRAELRKLQTAANDLKKEAQLKKQISDRKSKALKDPKTLSFIFGISLENRCQDGVFVYNCSRLIRMYQKVGPQNDGGVNCSGVVGIVDVPYLVLEPTHNKQDFADAKEYRHLLKALGEHMVQYWKDVGIVSQGITNFWESYGYISSNWKDPPSTDLKFVKKRAMQVSTTLQCDTCLKWRILPFSASNVGKSFDDDWVCSMNADPAHNRCNTAEQTMNMPEGVIKKDTKTKEQKEKEIEDEIRRKQEQLDKLQKTRSVGSSRELRKPEPEKPVSRAASSVTSSRTNSMPSRAAPAVTLSKKKPEVKKSAATSSQEYIRSPPPAKSSYSSSRSTNSRNSAPVKKSPAAPSPSLSSRNRRSNEVVEKKKEIKVQPKPPARKPASLPPPPRSKRKGSATSSRSSDSDGPPSKKRAQKEKAPVDESDDDDDEDEEAEGATMDVEQDESFSDNEGETGARVEARVQDKWYMGTVTKVNKKGGKMKIKFDKNPKDKYDKWFDEGSEDVRTIDASSTKASDGTAMDAESTSAVTAAPPSPASEASHGTTAETPSSSTANNVGSGQALDEIADGYRTCLRYFLPPQWPQEKEDIANLNMQELASFPLDEFFDHYEKGLRKLVSSFQNDAVTKQKEAEAAKTKLSHLRKLIAKLLKTINEEFEIDQENDTDQVDELLAACVKQAMQQTE